MHDIEEILKQLSLEEKASLCSGADFWHTKAVERLNIPSLMMADGPHGLRKQLGSCDHLGVNESIKTVCFPTASAQASTFDRNLMKELGASLAEICLAEDVSVLLGPGVNIKRSPLCGRNFEYYSEDPYLAGEMAAAFIAALEKNGVCSAVKHFAANNQETARMVVSSQVDERTLFEIYFPAFESAVKQGGASVVMTAYNKVNGVYASQNEWLLSDVLRGKWGFTGVTVTDWSAISDRVEALSAGQDLEMPYSGGETDSQIAEAVRSGKLSEEVLDNTVIHLLKLVDKAVEARSKKQRTVKDYHSLAYKISSESAVLLKNDGLLPLSPEKNYACIGELSILPRFQGGGSSRINPAKVDIPLDELKKYTEIYYSQGYSLTEEQDEVLLIEQAVETAKNAGGAVIFAGFPFISEGADRKNIDLPQNQNRLIEEICRVQKNTVVVLMTGSAVAMPWHSLPKAVINFHLGGQAVGSAIADVLFGKVNPSGKLSETYPLRIEDTPCYLEFPGNGREAHYREGVFVGYRYYDSKKMEVLYPFGHGLSYTSFEYGGIEQEKLLVNDNEIYKIKIKIKNTGAVFGKEAVQLYVRELHPEVVRPYKELKGYEKVGLNAGEEKEMVFVLDSRAFSYYNEESHDFEVGSCNFELLIGSSSRDIRQCAKITVNKNAAARKPIDILTPVSEVLACGKEEKLKILYEALSNIEKSITRSKNPSNGQSFDFEKAIKELPLRALVSLTQGKISLLQIEQLIKSVNSN